MTLLYLLTVIICSGYVLLMASYLYGWGNTTHWLFKPGTLNLEPATRVSIIIPARNEELNILNCLSSIYKQTYPLKDFEVIVVDDHSTDRTPEIIELQHYQNLKLIRLSENQIGKKQAITEGVKNAAGNLIITTDADCEMGKNWLSTIVSFYEEKKSKMIISPVLLKGENSFQKIIQSQEMTVLTACACASVYYNLPILCSGANLAYEKSAFFWVNGFEGVDKTTTGDDMFLMLKVHQKFPKEISYLKSKEAVVFTHPARSYSEALGQRKRWASKTFSYSSIYTRLPSTLSTEVGQESLPTGQAGSQKQDGFSHVTWVATLIFSTNFLILFSGIMSAINLNFVLVPALCFFAKCVVDFMLLYSASSFLGKKFHPLIFVIASAVYPVYVSFTGLISPLTNYSWRGRKP